MRGDAFLHRHRTGDRIDDGVELHQGSVAHELDDAALMLGEQRIDHFSTQRLDRRERRRLVRFDQARIADDVGRHDRRQPPFYPGGCQREPLRFCGPAYCLNPYRG